MKTAAILLVGNEILSGKIIDRNLIVLAQTLRRSGIKLARAVTVLDQVVEIADEIKVLSEKYDFVFTSGGIGPTHDDVTLDGVAKAFHVNLVIHPELKILLEEHYLDRISTTHMRMARVPEGSRVVSSEMVPWPCIVMKNVWILPGIPEAFVNKMSLIENELSSKKPFLSEAVYTILEESDLKEALDGTVEQYGEVEIGSYPVWRNKNYKTKITFDSTNFELILEAKEHFMKNFSKNLFVNIEEKDSTEN